MPSRETLLADFQLLRRLSGRLFPRIKGRNGELQGYLFDIKAQWVERVI
jgi:hypothetical protein